MWIDILSLFPNYFRGPFDESIVKRARERELVHISVHNIRDFSQDRHHKVDDRPYGGGPGMVMTADPICRAVRSLKKENSKVVYLSPQGPLLTPAKCQELAKLEHLILLAGHYEGVDERAIELVVDEELSIGDYVLTNGALAACVVVDALIRFIPGVLGHEQAASEDSFSEKNKNLLEGPQYTRPEVFENLPVPQVLLSGDHQKIERWRREEAITRTKERRVDLYLRYLEEQKRCNKENR